MSKNRKSVSFHPCQKSREARERQEEMMNGLLFTIIITLIICRVNATEQNRIVVMTPNVQDETVQSLSERFYDARDVYDYVTYGESSNASPSTASPSTKDFIISIQEFIETYTPTSSWLHLIVLAPWNHEDGSNHDKTDDTNSIVRLRNLLQSQTTKNISATSAERPIPS